MDCIDCAADASVVNAVNEGINAAQSISTINRPWVMISVNDDRQDLHFRKAGTLLTTCLASFVLNCSIDQGYTLEKLRHSAFNYTREAASYWSS